MSGSYLGGKPIVWWAKSNQGAGPVGVRAPMPSYLSLLSFLPEPDAGAAARRPDGLVDAALAVPHDMATSQRQENAYSLSSNPLVRRPRTFTSWALPTSSRAARTPSWLGRGMKSRWRM